MTDIISTHDFESSAAWKAEINRRLRVAIIDLHAAGAPAPTEEDLRRMYETIALDAYQPTRGAKPQ
jgi:hypothetical protein